MSDYDPLMIAYDFVRAGDSKLTLYQQGQVEYLVAQREIAPGIGPRKRSYHEPYTSDEDIQLYDKK